VDHCKTFVGLLAHDEHPNPQLKSCLPNQNLELSLLPEQHY